MSAFGPKAGRLRRIRALIWKESLQVMRDPSSFVVGFVLPVILLILYGYGISFDAADIRVGLVIESPTAETAWFLASLSNTPFFDVRIAHDRRAFYDLLAAGQINVVVDLPGDFSQRLARGDTAGVEIITDGSDPNTANLAAGYLQGAWQSWLDQRALALGVRPPPNIDVIPRVWFNPELESRRFLVPGSIALIEMMIGALLTALVVAREWERGTIEALLATPVGIVEFVIGKLVPNFVLGLCAMTVCVLAALFLFHLPMRGSLLVLYAFTSIFLFVALGIGLLISTVARAQFLASQMAMLVAFMPGIFFSGFLFEIASMPLPLQWFSLIVPARYYVQGLQTLFLAGNIGSVLIPCSLALSLMTAVIFLITFRSTKTRLD